MIRRGLPLFPHGPYRRRRLPLLIRRLAPLRCLPRVHLDAVDHCWLEGRSGPAGRPGGRRRKEEEGFNGERRETAAGGCPCGWAGLFRLPCCSAVPVLPLMGGLAWETQLFVDQIALGHCNLSGFPL